jgi:hypothetical protein
MGDLTTAFVKKYEPIFIFASRVSVESLIQIHKNAGLSVSVESLIQIYKNAGLSV